MDQHEATVFERRSCTFGESISSDGHNGKVGKALEELREDLAGGLLYTHSRANANTRSVHAAASTLYALTELLEEKGIIQAGELDTRKATVAQRVAESFLDKGMGVKFQEPELDKYAFAGQAQIDCEGRVHLCKAACCRMWFPLSRQDINEGVIRWDLRFPYVIARDDEGYCRHLERDAGRCTVYPNRPVPCRAFDCRGDQRIWLDFESKVINPNLEALFQQGEHNTAM